MEEKNGASDSERIRLLEGELKAIRKQIETLTEELFGSIAILCLPLSRNRRLELGFKQIGRLPNGVLRVIVKRYMAEGRASDIAFDEMVGPVVAAFGFERAWKIISAGDLRDAYGDYAVLRWEDMAKAHPCEG